MSRWVDASVGLAVAVWMRSTLLVIVMMVASQCGLDGIVTTDSFRLSPQVTPIDADRVATATVAATEMKSTVPQTYPRYWSDVGNMGRGETFADSSDEIGDSTGNFEYSFLPYCAGRVG
jgi:hypothetical protein